jgi:hypothetical protein
MSLSSVVGSVFGMVVGLTMAIARVFYRILVALVGIVFLPGAYIMRGRFLRGIVVSLLLILVAIVCFPLLLIFYPMAVADAATC